MRLFVGRLKRSKGCNVNFTLTLQEYHLIILSPTLQHFNFPTLQHFGQFSTFAVKPGIYE